MSATNDAFQSSKGVKNVKYKKSIELTLYEN